MTAAPIDRPYRGSSSDRPTGVPLPPADMSLLRNGQLRKQWHYVSFWSREMSFCAATASVGPLKQQYWGIWDRAARQFREGAHIFKRPVKITANRVEVADGDNSIDVSVGFNAITGLFDTPDNSERTRWIDGVAQEIGPTTFSEDLSTVFFAEGGSLRFQPEALIDKHDNYLVVRSDYLHWFGTFSGTLPGGVELREGCGVMERHDARW
jgi:Protein of unknown function (DUF2804)